MLVLEADTVCKSYGTKKVLRGMSLAVHSGEIIAVLGQNGAGKTTFMRILSTLLQQDSGVVHLFGEEPFSRTSDISRLRMQIGYVGQDSERSAYGRLTVRENLLFFGRLMGLSKKEVLERITELACCFEFDDKLDSLFMNLSGGQKQTVVIIRALLHNPKLVLLDEPTKGLDPVRAQSIRVFLKKYIVGRGKTMLLTSHILQDIEYLSDRVAFLRNGTIPYCDTPARICGVLGYSDIIEISGASDRIRNFILNRNNVHVLSDDGTKLLLGMNDINYLIQNIAVLGNCELSYRKVNLEDAYMYLTQTALCDEIKEIKR
jgi:ABC-type multidrug transport system, ATPase component